MARYRKKPVVIDAWQYHAGLEDFDLSGYVIDGRLRYNEDGTATIRTLEGEMVARPGDWIIRGVKGEIYPCKPEIFTATYDPA